MCVLGDRVHIYVFGGRMCVCVKWVRVCVRVCASGVSPHHPFSYQPTLRGNWGSQGSSSRLSESVPLQFLKNMPVSIN